MEIFLKIFIFFGKLFKIFFKRIIFIFKEIITFYGPQFQPVRDLLKIAATEMATFVDLNHSL